MGKTIKVTYFGTTMLLFDDGETELLFDCHVSRPSVFKCLFGKLSTDEAVADRVLREFDFSRLKGVFISHSHHDHVLDAPYFARHSGAYVFGSPSALNVARGNGVPNDRLRSYQDCSEYRIGDFRIKVLASVHSEPHWYNDNIGETIDAPLKLPAATKEFKEGGSFDFLISHCGRSCLIRPSYNYLQGQLDDVRADVLFLGIGGLSKDTPERRTAFFAETIGKTQAELVVPIHWDNFFLPLFGDVKGMPPLMENTGASMRLLSDHCAANGVQCCVQLPLTSTML